MKSLISASALTTGGIFFAFLVALGILGAGLLAAVGLLWKGGKSLFRFGEYVNELKAAIDKGVKAAERFEQLDDRVETLERWKAEVDPFISEALRTRLGLDKDRKLPGA